MVNKSNRTFFFLSFVVLLTFSSCINKVRIKRRLNSNSLAPTATPTPTPATLNWNFTNLVILPGEEVPFQILNGTGPYTTSANAIGTFDTTTLIYTAPINQAPIAHTVGISDFDGVTGTNNFKISGFQTGSRINFPLAFGEQNFVTGSAVTTDGNIFVSSIVGDSPGWERWVVFKSTDLGSTWSEVDQYVPYEEGESHPLAMLAKNNDIYTCGYVWESSGTRLYNSEWIVRKSSDAGTTWTNVDVYHSTLLKDHVCYDITQDSSTGHLFTSGYEDFTSKKGIIRESTDNGATWTTINTTAGVIFFSIRVSPNGTLWAMADNGTLYIGTYALGNWNWVTAGTLIDGADTTGFYQIRGKLRIIDDNTAYYSYSNNRWFINKTVDGGATWTNSYTGPANSRGRDIIETPTSLMAVGMTNSSPMSFDIIKSTNAGASWTSVYNESTVEKHGQVLIQANDSSVIAFGNYDNDPNQIISVRSTNDGASWTSRPDIQFKQSLYTSFNDFTVDSNGTMWAVGWIYFIDNFYKYPWVTMKSTDNGITWTQSDVYTDPTGDLEAESIGIGPNNEIYVSGSKELEFIVRKSINNGASWSQVDSHTPAGSLSSWGSRITVAPNGDVFYGGKSFKVTGNISEIHKGGNNGTVWSTVKTFPTAVGSTNFQLTDLKAFSNGSLWVTGYETDASSQSQGVAYVSTDNGNTFVEKYRVQDSYTKQIEEASNGDLYLLSSSSILKSTDNGNTWNDYYLYTLGPAQMFALDSNDKVYIVNNNSQIITMNQFTNNWFVTYEYPTAINYQSAYIENIKRCGNLASICAIGEYDKSIVGSYIGLIPLIVP